VKIKTTFLPLFLLINFGISAQDDAYKAILKRSSVCIHKAQKHMLAAQKPYMGGRLARAVLLQSYSIKLYQEKKLGESACSSELARNLAFEIIKEISTREDDYSKVTDEEKKLAISCDSEEDILKACKKALKDLPGKDEDYKDPASLNYSNIDIK